jgi:hypothetical protein
MSIFSTGTGSYGWCLCEHAFENRDIPTLAIHGNCDSCCNRCEQDHNCCCTVEHKDDELRIDGSLPQSRLDDDGASAMQSPPESMPRIAYWQQRCIEPAFRIDHLPPHLCTTVLLI